MPYLSLRINKCTREEYVKLCRLMLCISGALDLLTKIGADGFHEMIVFMDASHAAHPDFWSHNGVTIIFGSGLIILTRRNKC